MSLRSSEHSCLSTVPPCCRQRAFAQPAPFCPPPTTTTCLQVSQDGITVLTVTGGKLTVKDSTIYKVIAQGEGTLRVGVGIRLTRHR